MIRWNTNENPYPPSPKVAEALQKFELDSLRLYPDPASTDLVNALAEKYQAALAAKKDRSYTSYSWNGGYYKKWLAKQDVEINDKIWDRVSVGNITLKHDKVNYVNGQDEKDSDENENRKK